MEETFASFFFPFHPSELDVGLYAGGGLGIVCSMPSYGRKEKEEWGLTIASAPATTAAPALRYVPYEHLVDVYWVRGIAFLRSWITQLQKRSGFDLVNTNCVC